MLLWDVGSGMLVRALDGHTNFVAGIAFSKDGTTLATVGNEGTLRLWRAATFAEIDRHPATLQSMLALAATQNRHRRFSDAETTLRRTLRLQEKTLTPGHEDIKVARAEIVKAMRAQDKLPIISRQPNSVKTAVGNPVKFTVHVDGDGPWSYQWFHNDQPIESATHSTLQIPSMTKRNVGRYCIQVRPLGDNAVTAVQSETAYLVNAESETLAAGLMWERFNGVRTGRKLSGFTNLLPFRHRPDSQQVLSSFEIPSNVAHHYGGRLTGLLIPPKTGDYVFSLVF